MYILSGMILSLWNLLCKPDLVPVLQVFTEHLVGIFLTHVDCQEGVVIFCGILEDCHKLGFIKEMTALHVQILLCCQIMGTEQDNQGRVLPATTRTR